MDSLRTLLDGPQLAVITRYGDSELTRIQNIIERKALVEGRTDLEELLGSGRVPRAGRRPSRGAIGICSVDCSPSRRVTQRQKRSISSDTRRPERHCSNSAIG